MMETEGDEGGGRGRRERRTETERIETKGEDDGEM